MCFAALVIVTALARKNVLLWPLSGLYVINSVINIVCGFYHIKQTPFIGAGLALFFACDILAGLDFLGVVSTADLNYPWLFYIPAQTCLALSVAYAKK